MQWLSIWAPPRDCLNRGIRDPGSISAPCFRPSVLYFILFYITCSKKIHCDNWTSVLSRLAVPYLYHVIPGSGTLTARDHSYRDVHNSA